MDKDKEKSARSEVTGCIATIIILCAITAVLWGTNKGIALIITSKAPAIQQTIIQDSGCFVMSDPVYMKYEIGLFHSRFDPRDHETLNVCGVRNRLSDERKYLLLLSDYVFVPFKKRNLIVNDSAVIRYTMKEQKIELSLEKESGYITYISDNLYFSLQDTTLALKPITDTLQSYIYFNSIDKSYLYVEQYFEISESQLYLLQQSKKAKVIYPIHINGVDDALNLTIRSKQLRQLSNRFTLISDTLSEL